MRSSFFFTSLCALALAARNAQAQYLLVTDSTNKRVILLDAQTGAVVDPEYVDLTPAVPQFPIEAIVVGSQIWVTDQVGNKLMRFSADGQAFHGNVAGGMDDIRGAAELGGRVYVANGGSNTSSPGDVVMMFSSTGSFTGSFPVAEPSDVLVYNGDFLVPDESTGVIARYATSGIQLANFHAPNGPSDLQDPRQIALDLAGHVIAAGHGVPAGIHAYDANGAQVGYWAAPGAIHGVAQLASGAYLFTNTTGVHTFDPDSGAITDVLTGFEAQYVTPFAGAPDPIQSFCAGDGALADHTTPCPCANDGAPGRGCANSFDAGGALLTATGVPHADDVVLHAEFEPTNAFTLFLQHDAAADTLFHDGVLCAGGNLVRLRGRGAIGGEARFPDDTRAEDSSLTLAQRGGVAIGLGARRYYSAWYRNASTTFCPPATANVTNGVRIDW